MASSGKAPAPILIGTCNWADHEDFYPTALEKGKAQRDKLAYYARLFPLVEADTTFYGIPAPSVTARWAEQTPDGFLFNVKAYRSLTYHERVAGTPRPPSAEEIGGFLAALEPLREAGRLMAVHYQFPPWFTDTLSNREVLLEVRDRHPDDIVAIEFRHRSWFDGDAWPHTEELLRELDCTYVGVDAPQIGSGTAPPFLAITSRRLCIARFHGRNTKTWYRGGPKSTDRFNYLYSPDELGGWVPAIKAAAAEGVAMHVLMNNNRSNYAVANAYDIAHLLEIPLPRPPPGVVRTLTERDGAPPDWLHGVADESDEDTQGSLDLGV